MIGNLSKQIDALVWGDRLHRYGLLGRVLTGILQYLYALLRDIFSGQLTLRSMSLVYTTLLSVVPLIAFSFSVLKGLGVQERLEVRLAELLDPLGEKNVDMITGNLMDVVAKVDGGVLGSIGLIFFIYTAISMVQKIEESFNYVWYVAKPRSFARRFAEYMLVLLIGPVAMVIALGAIASLENEAIVIWLANNAVLGPLFAATTRLTPFLLVSAVFTFMYWYMPNAKVRLRAALVGGVAGGFLWATAGVLFAAFVKFTTNTQAVYATFAIAIFTLIWLYLNWLILLIGAQLAFYFQNPVYLRIGRQEPRLSNAMRERLALNIMLKVGSAFRSSDETIDLRTLSQQMRIPSITVAPIIEGLEDSGLLTTNEKEDLLPGRELTRISLDDIFDVVRVEGETGSYRDPHWDSVVENLGTAVDESVRKALADRSLADLVDELEDS